MACDWVVDSNFLAEIYALVVLLCYARGMPLVVALLLLKAGLLRCEFLDEREIILTADRSKLSFFGFIKAVSLF